MPRASKMVDQYLDVVSKLVKNFGRDVRVDKPRGSRDIRVSIGSPGTRWSVGKGSTFSVALKRALVELKADQLSADGEEDEELYALVDGVV